MDKEKTDEVEIVKMEFGMGGCDFCHWPVTVKYITSSGKVLCFQCVADLQKEGKVSGI